MIPRAPVALRGGPYDGHHSDAKYGVGYFEPEITYPGKIVSMLRKLPRARYRVSDSGRRVKVWTFDPEPWFPVPETAYGMIIYDYIEED